MMKTNRSLLALLLVLDLGLSVLALFLANYVRHVAPLGVNVREMGSFINLPIVVMVVVIWPLFLRLLNVYEVRRQWGPADEGRRLFAAVSICVFVLAGILYFSYREISRLMIIYFYVFDLAMLLHVRLLLRGGMRLAAGRSFTQRRVVIAGAGEIGLIVAQAIAEHPRRGLDLVGFVDDELPAGATVDQRWPRLGKVEDLPQVLREERIDEVIFALPAGERRRVAKLCWQLASFPVRLCIVPDVFEAITVQARVDDLWGIPLVAVKDLVIGGFQWAVKRVVDIIVSALALVLLSPLLAVIALAIRLGSPGPVLFRQERVGEDARPFRMLKFRTMVQDADAMLPDMIAENGENGRPVHKRRGDPRVTRVGHLLRRTSLDELPQLCNVLKGEMSLVGPRPELPLLVQRYQDWQYRRFAVRPGLTGWWQVNGRGELPMHLNTEYDLYYIRHYSLLLDLIIVLRTVGAVLRGRGAF